MSQEKYKIRLLDLAEEDLMDIISYIAAENPVAAEKLLDKIETNLANLSAFPLSGIKPKDKRLASKGYRYGIVENYLIFYTITDKTILVHRIVHGARDYKRFL